MNILFLTSRLPHPPDRGDRLRAFNFIRSLSQCHHVHLLSFIATQDERDHIPPLKELCQEVHVVHMDKKQSLLAVGLNLWRGQPLQAQYYRSIKMQSLINRTLVKNKFDVIYVHLFRMAQYVSDYDEVYRIVDLTDVISQEIRLSMPYRTISSKLIYLLEHPRIERYERWLVNHFEETWLISEYDHSVLASRNPDANIQIVRNGVDTNKFFPAKELETPNSLIFVGHMGVFHNVDAALFLSQEILPKVQAEIPETHLNIVGTAPCRQVKALASITGVDVTGYLTDLNKALNKAAVFVAPLRFAAGVQNKVLEAMSAGIPVITTNLVNRGLGAQPGRDLLIAETSEEFASAIVSLLQDSSLRNQLGTAARNFVHDQYRWDFVINRMEFIQNIIMNTRT